MVAENDLAPGHFFRPIFSHKCPGHWAPATCSLTCHVPAWLRARTLVPSARRVLLCSTGLLSFFTPASPEKSPFLPTLADTPVSVWAREATVHSGLSTVRPLCHSRGSLGGCSCLVSGVLTSGPKSPSAALPAPGVSLLSTPRSRKEGPQPRVKTPKHSSCSQPTGWSGHTDAKGDWET